MMSASLRKGYHPYAFSANRVGSMHLAIMGRALRIQGIQVIVLVVEEEAGILVGYMNI
jgi:hypothetical protein